MSSHIHIESYGDGECFVISCGLSQTTANWRGLVKKYPNNRWVLFDPRGQGRSEIGKRPYSLSDHTRDLHRVWSSQNISKATLLGFSHGGRVALNFAATYPGLVKNLILVSTAAHVSPLRRTLLRSWWELLNLGGVSAMAWGALPSILGPKILADFQNNPEFLVKGLTARNTTEGLQAMLEGMSTYPPVESDAKRVDCPTLVLRGEKDPLIDEDDDAIFMKTIHDCHVEVFPACGHTLALEKTDKFWETLTSFLKPK